MGDNYDNIFLRLLRREFKPITQLFCKDTKELLEKVPNVKYLLCIDFMDGRCFKRVSAEGVGGIVKI